MKITPTSGLTPDEIDVLISEAASAANRDQHAKELISLRNRLDSLTRNAQRTLREVGSVLTPDERDDAQQVFEECTAAAQSEDEDELRRVLTQVERVATVLTTAMLNAPPGMNVGRTTPANGQDASDPNYERY